MEVRERVDDRHVRFRLQLLHVGVLVNSGQEQAVEPRQNLHTGAWPVVVVERRGMGLGCGVEGGSWGRGWGWRVWRSRLAGRVWGGVEWSGGGGELVGSGGGLT